MIKDAKYICTKCGSVVKPRKKIKYPTGVRLFFALLFLLSLIGCFSGFGAPIEISAAIVASSIASALFFLVLDAILYCALTRENCCPICDGEGTVIPTSTPIAKMLMSEIYEKVIKKSTAKPETAPEPKPETKDE